MQTYQWHISSIATDRYETCHWQLSNISLTLSHATDDSGIMKHIIDSYQTLNRQTQNLACIQLSGHHTDKQVDITHPTNWTSHKQPQQPQSHVLASPPPPSTPHPVLLRNWTSWTSYTTSSDHPKNKANVILAEGWSLAESSFVCKHDGNIMEIWRKHDGNITERKERKLVLNAQSIHHYGYIRAKHFHHKYDGKGFQKGGPNRGEVFLFHPFLHCMETKPLSKSFLLA